MKKELENKQILLFDGYCNLCNASVQFVLKHERNEELFFTSLQSDAGKEILQHYSIDHQKVDSIVFIENNNAYIKSSAALRASKYLKGLYPILFAFIIVPPFIRNFVYDFIARNRYKWYGKSETCMIPEKNIQNRFL